MGPATAYVPGFETDVFISYSHVDNFFISTGQRWVGAFHSALENRLARRVGRLNLVRIWRDEKLDGSQAFDDVIEKRLAGSAVFVALNSRGYLVSDYCKKELHSFHAHAARSRHGLQVGERRRAVHVLLTNLQRTTWPTLLTGTSGFHFHDGPEEERSDDGRIAEPLKPGSELFDQKLRSLADAIFHVLEDLKARRVPQGVSSAASQTSCIYLADTADTLNDVRLRLAADLRQAGKTVIADVPPPFDAPSHATKVRSAVGGASLSVHLLDGWPGRTIEGEPATTYPRKQVEIALETATPQLVWTPPSIHHGEPSRIPSFHRDFLAALERGARSGKPYEFVRTAPEAISQLVLAKLQSLESRAAGSPLAPLDGTSQTVLLDTHLKDQMSAFELGAFLVGRGLQPFIHQETDNPVDGIKAFESQLTRVKTLVVFFGRVSQAWMEQRVKYAIQFVARQLANDIEPTLQACYVYVLPPQKHAPALGRGLFNVSVLDGRRSERIDPDVIAPLLRSLGGSESR